MLFATYIGSFYAHQLSTIINLKCSFTQLTVIENIDIELNNCEIANIMLLFMYVIFS